MKIFVLLICALLLFPVISLAGWQETLEQNFDIVETFDGLQDWNGSTPDRGVNLSADKMPKKLDGSASVWNRFDWWPTVSPDSLWIAYHGTENVAHGTGKSLIMDMDQNTDVNKGPARFGLFFGGQSADEINPYNSSGIEESGYRSDAYIFELVKFPTNIFPTQSEDNGYGAYWKYFSYFKWHVMSTGNTAIRVCTEGRDDCEYGASNIHTMLTVSDSGHPHFKLEYYSDAYTNGYGWEDLNLPDQGGGSYFQKYSPTTSESFLDNLLGGWFALEVHTHRGDPGVANGYQEYWLYDMEGNQLFYGKVPADYAEMTSVHDWGFNRFFQGGNISYQVDVDEQGLDTAYYIDDIIIDGNRIGPTYFQLLNGAGPGRSHGLPTGEQPAGTTQVTMSLTTDVNATCKYGTDGLAGIEYDSLAYTFTTTGGTSHSVEISGLTDGGSYSRAVRCTDGSEVNDTDYIISWSVASLSTGGGHMGPGTGRIVAGTGSLAAQ